MQVKDIFEMLSHGEFSQIKLGGEDGLIDPTNHKKILSHINLGLLVLYKRFALKNGTVQFKLLNKVTIYSLEEDNDLQFISNPEEDDFNGGVLKISRVLTDSGRELHLNDNKQEWSCHTPTPTKLVVPKLMVTLGAELPDEYKTDSLIVDYVAKHPVLSNKSNIPNLFLELPETHIEPLLYYVAARVFTPLGLANNEGKDSNKYYAMFEAACQQLEVQNYEIDQVVTNTRASRNGWV